MAKAYMIERPITAFALTGGKKKRTREQKPNHLAWIRTLPCLVSGRRAHIEAAHVRYGDRIWGKPSAGIGTKPDDRWCVPLAQEVHRDYPDSQHSHGERAWWEAKGIDPLAVASALWGVSGDDDAAEEIIRTAREKAVTMVEEGD